MGQQGTSYKKKEVHIQNTRSTKETKQKVNNNHCFGKNFRLKLCIVLGLFPHNFSRYSMLMTLFKIYSYHTCPNVDMFISVFI